VECEDRLEPVLDDLPEPPWEDLAAVPRELLDPLWDDLPEVLWDRVAEDFVEEVCEPPCEALEAEAWDPEPWLAEVREDEDLPRACSSSG